MAIDESVFHARVDELQKSLDGDAGVQMATMNAALQGTLTLVRALYGLGSAHESTLTNAVKASHSAKDGTPDHNFKRHVRPAVKGTLDALRGDLRAGLVGDLHRRGMGEVLADMLTLAKEAHSDHSGRAKNVAAVLAAAAFEDTIRKLGSALAKIGDRRPLADVLVALKDARTLEGASYSTAQSYLKFRNDALHADWDKLDLDVIGSCIAFVEHLLLKHFS